MNNKRVLLATNIIVVQVTATPYCLQSIASMVSMDLPLKNEVYWSSIPEQYCGLEVGYLGGFLECKEVTKRAVILHFCYRFPTDYLQTRHFLSGYSLII